MHDQADGADWEACHPATLVGEWLGTTSDHVVTIEINLCHLNQQWFLCSRDRRYPHPPTVTMTFVTKTTFTASMPHWIMRTQILLHGTFDGDDSLTLEIRGDGMTGLEDMTAFLHKRKESNGLSPQPNMAILKGENDPRFQRLISTVQHHFSASNSEPLKPRIESLLIMKGVETLFEGYFQGTSPEATHLISSCTKSITSILAGIAIDQGLFSLDDTIVEHFPSSLTSSSTWGNAPSPIRVRHVLSMTTGTKHSPSDSQDLLETTDVEHLVLSSQRIHPPGSIYHYDNALPSLIGCLIERRSGLALEDFARRYFFNPLDIYDYRWTQMRPAASEGKFSVCKALEDDLFYPFSCFQG